MTAYRFQRGGNEGEVKGEPGATSAHTRIGDGGAHRTTGRGHVPDLVAEDLKSKNPSKQDLVREKEQM